MRPSMMITRRVLVVAGLFGAIPSAAGQNFRISVTNAPGIPCGGTTTDHYYTNQSTPVTLVLPTCARYVMINGWVNGGAWQHPIRRMLKLLGCRGSASSPSRARPPSNPTPAAWYSELQWKLEVIASPRPTTGGIGATDVAVPTSVAPKRKSAPPSRRGTLKANSRRTAQPRARRHRRHWRVPIRSTWDGGPRPPRRARRISLARPPYIQPTPACISMISTTTRTGQL